jgi:hypothetical protein
MLIAIVSMCGWQPATTPDRMARVLRGDGGHDGETLERFISYCSNGVASAGGSLVFPEVIQLPCAGSTSHGVFNSSGRCGRAEVYAWQVLALSEMERVLPGGKAALRRFRHRVVIPPAEAPCAWAGLANVGWWDPFVPYAHAWVHGRRWDRLGVFAHEVAHNLGLGHAGSAQCDYCDVTCTMGFCCVQRCFNAPHMWQLGWAAPLAVLRPPLLATQVELPAQHGSAGSQNTSRYVKVPQSYDDAATAWYLSFRRPGALDQFGDSPAVLVHEFDERPPVTNRPTALRARLAFGESWGAASAAVRVQVSVVAVDPERSVATVALSIHRNDA